jgi:hypothetical protein
LTTVFSSLNRCGDCDPSMIFMGSADADFRYKTWNLKSQI